MGYKLIADTEGNGLIPTLTKFHLLGLRDVDTRETFVFRNNDAMDNIAEGMEMLAKADTIIGHNWIAYDKKAIKKLCPWFKTDAEELDTMVLGKIAKPDIKSSDQALHKRGILPGKLVGSHSLKAWGYRLGKHKGDYAEVMAAKGLDPWAAWNQDMEDYLIGDLDVTEILYHGILSARLPQMTVDFEHEVAEIADQMRDNGFPFDIAGAQALAERLKSETEKLHDECVSFYGRKLVPVKKWVVGPLWDDPDGINKKKTYKQPREEFGEDHSRAWWGDVVVPKVNHHDKKKGQPYCPAKWVDFNPGSRPQIIDRFVDNHGWKPTEFTEAGNPSVDDAVLKTVAEYIPAAKPIAELFFMNKVYAHVATGDQAWIKHYNAETGCVHTTTDTGAAVTGRCAHSHFNIGQVPSVILGKDKVPLLGREGEFGWECRSLFGVNFGPKKGQNWIQVGVDLSGIEYRCLAELMAPFDDGATIALILSGQDPHTHNSKMTGIPDRGLVKRLLYGCVPMNTTALTRRGWKTYHELIVGEDIMTYNAETKRKEWQPLLEKVYYEDAPLVETWTNKTVRFVSTPNHRWFTKKRSFSGRPHRYYVDEVVTTETLTTEHAIIINAPMADGVDEVPIAGAHLCPKYQTSWVQKVLDMSQQQRQAFIAGFCIADGHWKESKDGRKPGRWAWCQNEGELSEAALLASYLVFDQGLYVSNRGGSGKPMISCIQGVNNNVTGQRLQQRNLPNAPVWCVRTKNQSWVMRQGNFITITGNTMYGAGDWKLGITANPLLGPDDARKLGGALRAQLMTGLPALDKAIQKVKKEAARGYILGLDGRKIKVRNEYSALNTRLQSDAALIAKMWMVLSHRNLKSFGANCGWDDDYVQLAFIHDECQYAAYAPFADDLARIVKDAAPEAGLLFNYRCPIAAEAKKGLTWSDCH